MCRTPATKGLKDVEETIMSHNSTFPRCEATGLLLGSRLAFLKDEDGRQVWMARAHMQSTAKRRQATCPMCTIGSDQPSPCDRAHDTSVPPALAAAPGETTSNAAAFFTAFSTVTGSPRCRLRVVHHTASTSMANRSTAAGTGTISDEGRI